MTRDELAHGHWLRQLSTNSGGDRVQARRGTISGDRIRARRASRSGFCRGRGTRFESLECRALLAADISAFPIAQVADFDHNGALDAADIDLLSRTLRQGEPHARFDLDGDGLLTEADHAYWVDVINRTYAGDANLDGEFDSSDMVAVFQAGLYENSIAADASWATGDWDGDGDFGTSDMVVAFQGGGFEAGPRVLRSPTVHVTLHDDRAARRSGSPVGYRRDWGTGRPVRCDSIAGDRRGHVGRRQRSLSN